MVSDSLDVSHELLGRYGGQMSAAQHRELQQALLPLLDETRGGLRKRAINCLGAPPPPAVVPSRATAPYTLYPNHIPQWCSAAQLRPIQ